MYHTVKDSTPPENRLEKVYHKGKLDFQIRKRAARVSQVPDPQDANSKSYLLTYHRPNLKNAAGKFALDKVGPSKWVDLGEPAGFYLDRQPWGISDNDSVGILVIKKDGTIKYKEQNQLGSLPPNQKQREERTFEQLTSAAYSSLK